MNNIITYRDACNAIVRSSVCDLLNVNLNNCHELIVGNRRMFIDYDGGSTRLEDLVERAKLLKLGRIAVFDMTDKNKTSYHIVFVDTKFSLQECKQIALSFPECDQSVYSTLQSLRMPFSTKNRQRRKLLDPIHSDIKECTRECYVQIDQFPYTTWEEYRNDKPQITRPHVNNGMINILMSQYFFFDDVNLRLMRMKPSFCIICKRIHEHDNLKIIDQNSVLCFRNPKKIVSIIEYAKCLHLSEISA